MKREKKPITTICKRALFCFIITLLFGKTITFCQVNEMPKGNFAPAGKVSIEFFENDQKTITHQPLSQTETENSLSVPVPKPGVTLLIFISLMIISWLRRRTPSEIPS